jgi:hypothetical protein
LAAVFLAVFFLAAFFFAFFFAMNITSFPRGNVQMRRNGVNQNFFLESLTI